MPDSLSVAKAEEIVQVEKIIPALPDLSSGCSSVPVLLKSPTTVTLEGELRLRYANNGFALTYRGKRIRGINYELGHTNNDGSYVQGWHEHIWKGNDDNYVILVAELSSKGKFQVDTDDLLVLVLKRWYIIFQGSLTLKLQLFKK